MVYNLVALQDAANGGIMNLVMIVALIAIFYFFMIRPQQKKQKEIKKFREGLGARVIPAGGIYGKIRGVKENSFVLEIADNVRITIDKGSVFPTAAEAQEAVKQNDGNN